jgi:hypothetical protein
VRRNVIWPEDFDSPGAVSDVVSLEGLGTMLSMPVFVHQACGLGIILEEQLADDVGRIDRLRVTESPLTASVANGVHVLLYHPQDVIPTNSFDLP